MLQRTWFGKRKRCESKTERAVGLKVGNNEATAGVKFGLTNISHGYANLNLETS